MKAPFDVIKTPVISEKGTQLQEKYNKYLFSVNPLANKIEIRSAVEELFNVKVKKVNTVTMRGKMKRRLNQEGHTSDWKKAVVTLHAGQKIDFV